MSARTNLTWRLLAWHLWSSPRYLMIGFIRAWRAVLSPLYGPTCRYYPSCSSYGLLAVTRHGAVRGGLLTVWRILRCNPFSDGGVDDVPPAGAPRTAITRWLAPASWNQVHSCELTTEDVRSAPMSDAGDEELAVTTASATARAASRPKTAASAV